MERTRFGRLAGQGVAPRGGGVVEKTAGDARWRPRCIARIVAHYHPQGNGVKQREKLVLAVYFIGNGQLLAALGTTSGQYAATISRLHALTETMFVVSLAVVGLECSFHCVYAVFVCCLGLRGLPEREAGLPLSKGEEGALQSSGCKGMQTF